jgi:hypothetical protein
LQDATGSVLGGEAFRKRVLKLLRITADKAWIPEIKKIERKHEIKDIVMGVAGYYGLTEDDLLKRRKKDRATEEDRGVFIKGAEWQEEC